MLEHFSGDLDGARHALRQRTVVSGAIADFAQSLTGEATVISENLLLNIDYESMAWDTEFNSDVFTVETGTERVQTTNLKPSACTSRASTSASALRPAE